MFLLARGRGDTQAELVVTRATQEQLAAQFEENIGRPPTDEERQAMVADWVDRELLVREAVALGLDRNDPVVRRRLLKKMEFVGTNLELPDEPGEATLRAFLAEHPARYTASPRVDVQTVAVLGDEAAASTVLEQLRAGADPKGVEGRYSAGRRYSAAVVTRTYGPDVAAAIADLDPNVWTMVATKSGFVLIEVTGREPGEALPFEKIRNRLATDWKAKQRRAALERRLDELRDTVEVVVE